MSEATIPECLQALLLSFNCCFTQPGFGNFVALVIGWIVCPGRHSISRVIQGAAETVGERHHSSLYRFLSRGAWVADSLGQVVFKLLLPFLLSHITAIVDDTLCHKSGPHIFGASMHFDAGKSTYGRGTSAGRKAFFAFGHNWVVLALWLPLPWDRERGLAIPILFRLYRSKKRCPERQYRKRTELAAELVHKLIDWLPADRQLEVVGDSEYACETLVKDLPPGVLFTGPMVMDAAVYDQPGKYKGRGRKNRKGKRLLSPQKLATCKSIPWEELTLRIYGRQVTLLFKSQVCMWYSVAGTRMVRMVVTRDPAGRLDDRAYFHTEPERPIARLLSQFARRWEIEVSFRNVKQCLGVEDPQNGWWRRKAGSPRPKKVAGPNPKGRRGEKAIVHTLAVVFATYAIVVLWYFQHGERAKDIAQVKEEAPWYRHKQAPSFYDMLAGIRREIWAARFSRHPVFKRVSTKIRELLPHWLLSA
ncbi:MAG: IS701 family transposase [Planctomycetota bacterium]|jgi:hypothetical protein